MVFYTLTQSIRPKIFNYHTFAKVLNTKIFVENPNTVLCACSKFDIKCFGKNHQHIVTDDLEIIFDDKF